MLKVTGVGLWSTSRGRGIGRSQLQREKRGVVSETRPNSIPYPELGVVVWNVDGASSMFHHQIPSLLRPP